jgi:hypothetical protein
MFLLCITEKGVLTALVLPVWKLLEGISVAHTRMKVFYFDPASTPFSQHCKLSVS